MNENGSSILDKQRVFFDPYPNLIGGKLPIPVAVKKIADELDGKTMTLREVLAKLKEVTDGELTIVTDAIHLRKKGDSEKLITFSWQVIRYR